MKQSAWYCFCIASTVTSRGPSALWQKAQTSVGRRENRVWRCVPQFPQLGMSPQLDPPLPLEPSLSVYPFTSCHCDLLACSWQNVGVLNLAGKAEGAWD